MYQVPQLLQYKKTLNAVPPKTLGRPSAQGGGTSGYPKRQSLPDAEKLNLRTSGWQQIGSHTETPPRQPAHTPRSLAVAAQVPAGGPATAEDGGQPRAASHLPRHS